jgi:hypothetical protein
MLRGACWSKSGEYDGIDPNPPTLVHRRETQRLELAVDGEKTRSGVCGATVSARPLMGECGAIAECLLVGAPSRRVRLARRCATAVHAKSRDIKGSQQVRRLPSLEIERVEIEKRALEREVEVGVLVQPSVPYAHTHSLARSQPALHQQCVVVRHSHHHGMSRRHPSASCEKG